MEQATMRLAEGHAKALPRRFAFTRARLDALTVPAGKDRIMVYDAKVPRLAFMLTGNGASSFYWYGKVGGRPVKYRIGDGTLSVEQARDLAAQVHGKVAAGENPQRERKLARRSQTLGQTFTWFLEEHSKVHKRSWASDQSRHDRHLKTWDSRCLKDITHADVCALHAQIGKGGAPGQANRVVALLSSIFNRARAIGYDGPNPAKGVVKFREESRERFLQADELPRFWTALKFASPDMRDFFTLLLLTGARRGNVMSMEWGEIDLDAATWTIPASKFKSGRPLTVALVPDAVKILRRRREAQQGAFVFPSDSKTGHVQEPKKAWTAICKKADLNGLRIHDLRRTLGSYQAACGASLHVIGKSLGHTQQQTTQIYARLNLDPVRASVSAAVGSMMKLARKGRKAGKR